MTFLADDASVKGVFVILGGKRSEYPRANTWVLSDGILSIRRKISTYAFREFAVFGRFDQVGYMGDAA